MKRIILSGGGTGGHIYPAIAVAEALTRILGAENVEILFVGAEGKMEMTAVPKAGYRINGVPIAGLQRSLSLKNLLLPFKVIKSIREAKKILKGFQPDVVVGFGGYASAPVLWAAQRMGIPTVIQEQNSYAGLVNKIVGGKAKSICVAYDGMERFFPAERIVKTGNPLRSAFLAGQTDKREALEYYGFNDSLPVILVVGGSLGTRTLNNMMRSWVMTLGGKAPVQVIWQTGRYYEQEMKQFLQHYPTQNIWQGAFIDRMDYAYAAADVVISRSGACTVSELCLAGKPTLFVPSPNVAEDHQTKNAQALVDKKAARMVADSEAVDCAISTALRMIADSGEMTMLSKNISKLAIADSADRVAAEVIKHCKQS
ncbi:MAG: undecaprenyldiphospho-muramoylpentapeptide beta-N-acetylglucosaminyltransferase [Rikenellaceae bacterium]|nr:undecaprenyldiphospho-muramoylpentapeptide beta-N-acetylglucosaminyltransferase [Rikenellaceae bacterium]